ncbi:hypothetical protein K492DRAFT_230042 [Lichtheimia hyalospora FSU 10163]|nr:hypothetical protein K492DRAFT_230042 [Lichtheimia hyalospora FSU 10163]
MGDSGLTQDDFRKLLQTPRPGSTTNETPQFKAPPPKTPRNTGAVFAQPQSVRKKRAKPTAPPAIPSNYRDRAAERRANETQDEGSTEELLQPREQDETLDAKEVYEQSKYLGGDVEHTHLVKGLDYSLLERVRTDLNNKAAQAEALLEEQEQEEQEEDESMVEKNQEIDEALSKIGKQEQVKVHTVLAKNIVHFFNQKQVKPSTDLFMPGRMAYVFEMADPVGHYNDAFEQPTSITRSKADTVRRQSDLQAETELVIRKISAIMRKENNNITSETKEKPKAASIKVEKKKEAPVVTFDGDIFADVGRDYELDESSLQKPSSPPRLSPEAITEPIESSAEKSNYFTGLVHEQEEDEATTTDVDMKEVSNLLSQATKRESSFGASSSNTERGDNKRPKFAHEQMDVDAADIDMYGLGSEALPTSFEDRRRTVAYESGEEGDTATSLIDQGTHRNKKAQLTRWDFDDEEQWQKYKDSVEIQPKSVSQFGVKLGDGRKRNREQRRGMSDKQKLNREYQMVKNIMDKKYGKK